MTGKLNPYKLLPIRYDAIAHQIYVRPHAVWYMQWHIPRPALSSHKREKNETDTETQTEYGPMCVEHHIWAGDTLLKWNCHKQTSHIIHLDEHDFAFYYFNF